MPTKKQELLEEFAKAFLNAKKHLGFKSSFKELDEIFFIKDAVLTAGFVSESFSRQLCRRIVDTYGQWAIFLQNLINPPDMISMHESKLFSQDEKKKILSLISEAMVLVSMNLLVGLSKDKKMEARLIDNSVNLWKNSFKPKLYPIMEKIHKSWQENKEE